MEKEIAVLLSRLLGGSGRRPLDLEASEIAIRDSMHQMGAVLLEKVIAADGKGYAGKETDCKPGHPASFVDYRWKAVLTVLGPVKVERAYYHCSRCGGGVIPKDRALDIVRTSFSPGIRRMMGRVGSKESFEAGGQDLEELAGVKVTAKQVERVAEAIGVEVEAMLVEERKAVPTVADKVVALKVVEKLYVAYDGTGVPMVAWETQGRAGKEGPAKTREANWDAFSLRRGSLKKASPCGMRIQPVTWVPLKRPNSSALASTPKPRSAACIRPNGWWLWEMAPLGFGGSPRSNFPEPFKLSIFTMPASTWLTWPRSFMDRSAQKESSGRRLATTNWMRGRWKPSLAP